MSEKRSDIEKFKREEVSQPEDLKLLQFIFKKYLKGKENQVFREKLFEEAGKEEDSDMAFMLMESLKLADKGKKLENDIGVFIIRNDLVEKVIKWLGLEKEKLTEEYNLQASFMGINVKSEKNTSVGKVVKFLKN